MPRKPKTPDDETVANIGQVLGHVYRVQIIRAALADGEVSPVDSPPRPGSLSERVVPLSDARKARLSVCALGLFDGFDSRGHRGVIRAAKDAPDLGVGGKVR